MEILKLTAIFPPAKVFPSFYSVLTGGGSECVYSVISSSYDPMDCSLPMGFSRQEYGSGLQFPPPSNLPDPGIKPTSPVSPALQADSLPLSHQGNPCICRETHKSGKNFCINFPCRWQEFKEKCCIKRTISHLVGSKRNHFSNLPTKKKKVKCHPLLCFCGPESCILPLTSNKAFPTSTESRWSECCDVLATYETKILKCDPWPSRE